MFKNPGHIFRRPVYLWILGVYPILHLYSVNIGFVMDHEMPVAMALVLAATTIVFYITRRVVSNAHKRAFMLAICSIIFSLSGHIYVIIFMPRSLLVWNIVSVGLTLMLMAAIHKFVPQQFFAVFTVPFNAIVITLLTLQLVAIASEAASIRDISQINSEYTQVSADRINVPKVFDSASVPDIYYIIPDGHPSDDWLHETLNYDNADFTSKLEERGFTVTRHARSNYGLTYLSLASTLNLKYYNGNPSTLNDLDYLNLSIANSEVSYMLQQLGYTYIQLMSGFFAPSARADIVRDFTPNGTIELAVDYDELTRSISVDTGTQVLKGDIASHLFRQPFIPLYVDTTALRIFRTRVERLLGTGARAPYHRFAAQRLPATIDEIKTIVSMPEATFTLVHFIKPHAPVTFNGSGDVIEADWRPTPRKFLSELEYVHTEFLRLIDIIQQGSSNPPVIMFQADHGSTLGDASTARARKVHFEVYAAYFMPESFSVDFPNPYTLINSFPLILNELFGTDIQPLPDLLIESTGDYDALFEQVDVTEEFGLN